jgi:radical SAM protein with 4Fe4S-binding SPASM domain
VEVFLGNIGRKLNREILQFAYNWQIIRPVGKPVVFQIELTNHCPMTCQMCPRTHAMERPLGYMSAETFRRIIDQATQGTSGVFMHHFGDSLLHPELRELIRYATDRGIRTYLSANPVLLTKQRIEALVDGGLHEIVLSLDGLTSETSQAVRGRAARNVELAERRVRELISYRKQRGSKSPYIILQIVRQKQNVHEIPAWLEKWQKVPGVDRVKVKSYVTWDGTQEEINSLRLDPSEIDSNLVCDKPWTSIVVLWDGRVVPCCFDYDGINSLGSLQEQSLTEIWHGERLAALREAHKKGNLSNIKLCANCTDKEGYPVKRLTYPLNRFTQSQSGIGDEWRQE